uniref:Polyprotein n=1 Tax=Chuzhou tick virus 2 TaxID=2972184 RepID=A0A9E7V1U6_9VIRU|nr:MAG: polyprotein [Chuzhou tick virus 2]
MDEGFRDEYRLKYDIMEMKAERNLIVPAFTAPLDRCWQKLFVRQVSQSFTFAQEKWVTKKQLRQFCIDTPLSTGTFDVQVHSPGHYHVVDGCRFTAREVIDGLSNSARLGGARERWIPPRLPLSVNLSVAGGRRNSMSCEPAFVKCNEPASPRRASAPPRLQVCGIRNPLELLPIFVGLQGAVEGKDAEEWFYNLTKEVWPCPHGGCCATFKLEKHLCWCSLGQEDFLEVMDRCRPVCGPDCPECASVDAGNLPHCWEAVFPDYDAGEMTLELFATMLCEPISWGEMDNTYMSLERTEVPHVWHVSAPHEGPAEGLMPAREIVFKIADLMDEDMDYATDVVELTTAVVLGTVGDVEPSLDVVAANHFSALTQAEDPKPWDCCFIFNEQGHGWCASDFLDVCPSFSRALDDRVGAQKGTLEVTTSLWNEICSVWGGEPIILDQQALAVPGGYVEEAEEVFNIVPMRPVGSHERKLPDDFVLVTHPDHIQDLQTRCPDMMKGVETYSVKTSSKDFIKLGQDILEGGVFALKDMKKMQNQLLLALKEAFPIMEQSDLIYLVSGTTFHYFAGSLFPDKQVFEICPVPREDNGVCPEFYLGHYASLFTENPRFGHQIGRTYNQWLTAPMYLKELDWEGEYKYFEPPKFHSIMPWAQERWAIESPNVGFKPYDDIVRKTTFVERDKIKAYFSLGSCRKITKETQAHLLWLRSLDVEWHVDPRWLHLLEGTDVRPTGFFNHGTGLHEFDWVVHHGGSGVVNTCLAVQVPQTILPQIGDQFIWRDALAKHCIRPNTSESELRAHLYITRHHTEVADWDPLLSGEFVRTLVSVGARPVKPFHLGLACCHDSNEYGLKQPDYVVAHDQDFWFTLFDTDLQRTGKSEGNYHLKWVSKECRIGARPIPGWRGTNVNATYPWHAHGWLGSHVEREGIDSSFEVPDEWLLWLANQSLTAKDKRLKRRSQRPGSGTCKVCGRHRELLMMHCSRCVGDIVCHAVQTGEIPDLPPFQKWSGNKLKGPDKSKAVGLQLSGTAIRSTRRYFQLDTRALDRAPNRSVARSLLDEITDWSDIRWVEAFWEYTHTKPPHYRFVTNPHSLIASKVAVYATNVRANIAQDLAAAAGKVLSISSPTSIARRLLGRNMLTARGRTIMHKKWHVLVDALRHYSELAQAFDLEVLPPAVGAHFPVLETLEVTSYICWRGGIAAPLRTRTATSSWLDTLAHSGHSLKVHLFSLNLPALGPAFGVFHAVVEYKGWYYELQQVAGNTTRINKSRWRPEATADRPLVKTIVVHKEVDGDLPDRVIHREFSGNDYKTLGDNCLVFANFLVYHLCGQVIPWRHFGAFGEDLNIDVCQAALKWATSHFFPADDEKRLSLNGMRRFMRPELSPYAGVAAAKTFSGPPKRIKDYGLNALRRVDASIEAFDRAGPVDTPWSQDSLVDLAILGYKKFGLSSHVVSQALLHLRMSSIPRRRREMDLYVALLATLRKFPSTRLAGDAKDLILASSKIRSPLRMGRKPAWAPLLNITVPRHWFREKDRLVEVRHDPENLTVGSKRRVMLDLPQIAKRYEHYFEGVKMPKLGFRQVKPGEYEIGVKVPIRTKLPVMDDLTWSLVKDLQDLHPFELGIFSLRFGTEKMAEKVTDRYFTGSFEPGELLSPEEQQEVAEAIFRNNRARFEKAQLVNPEEVWRKWHKNYSAGFPFRFNEKGNAKRQALIDACGGKEEFLAGVRRYIASPESFPTVSHAFIKDEVLPSSYIEREKIRTIIAQDPLNYFAEMAVGADIGKRMDPSSFSAVGVSPAHGELAVLAEQHMAYNHHYAMDITALDSTAAVDFSEVIKKLMRLSYQEHPQRDNIGTLIDASVDNLVASWIIDIHTGRARFKRQGFTTGHALTTPMNTWYVEALKLVAFHKTTGRPYDDFYETVKFSSFSDDNFWSTNLPRNVFSAQHISDYWLSRGVQVRVEGDSDNLGDISFLAKRFSHDPAHLAEIKRYAGVDLRVAVVHDPDRLLQKFSDYKKKNTLAYRWEKLVALQANCAHHKDIYDLADKYINALEKEMNKRKFLRKFVKQHPRKSYADIMYLMYHPTRTTKLVATSVKEEWHHSIQLWWDTLRVDIMAFDGTANTYARVLNQFSGLLELGGVTVEDPGTFLKQGGDLPTDPEFTLEHHCWLLNGCPQTFEAYRGLLQKTPFSAFTDAEGFWAQRERFDISEEMANGLRAKVLLLQVIYTVVAWLEKTLMAVPVIGPMYRLFCTAKGMSEQLYSRLNAMYYTLFGDSSLVLSSMMPKDRYLPLKVLAFRTWTLTTSTDLFDFSGDVEQFRGVADAAAKLGQDLHNLFFELDFSALMPHPDNPDAKDNGLTRHWEALDHMDSVMACKDLMEEGKAPLVSGPTGCGKSTDFVVNLHREYDTVIVAQPRRVLVKNSPVAAKRLYAGSSDKLTPGLINFGTSGYLRRVLGELPDNTILVLDEFHELDEDTLWLRDRYQNRCISITATPEFQGSSLFSPVVLTKSRNAGHTVQTLVLDTKGEIGDVWNTLLNDGTGWDSKKTLCVVPTLKMVSELARHATRLQPGKRTCVLYRGHDFVEDADWYFSTSIVDAGLTINLVDRVIDAGWSSGWKDGTFTLRPSSHNVSDQRRGRTGRVCDGLYIRLHGKYCDDPWDFSTPFLFNNWQTAKKWGVNLKRPLERGRGCLESLPYGYDTLLENKSWSSLVYLTYYYENRGDLARTRAAYQFARKFPDQPDVEYIMGPHMNKVFQDLHVVEGVLATYRIPGHDGNVWSHDGRQVRVETFSEPVPKHLQDYY